MRLPLVAGMLACAFVLSVAALFVGSRSSGEAPKTPSRQLDPRMTALMDDARDTARARERALGRPAARAERERSRTAYRGAGGEQAVALATRTFPQLYRGTLWRAPGSGDGERVVKRLDSHSVVVERKGRRSIAEAVGPVNSRGRSVDTRLERRDGALRPRNTVTPLRIGGRADEGVRLPSAGIAMRLRGASDAAATLRRDKAIFTDALTDADLTLAAMPTGFGAFLQLRSPASPEEVRLAVDVPRGATLRLTGGGLGKLPRAGTGAEVVRDGKRLASITPPTAFDADGRRVRAAYAVEGDDLVVRVAHRGRDVHYPVLVDPYVEQFYTWGAANQDRAGWGYWESDPKFQEYDCSSNPGCWVNGSINGRGLYVQATPGGYAANTRGEWYYSALHGANIVRVDWSSWGQVATGANCTYGYISDYWANAQGSVLYVCGSAGQTQTGHFTSCTAHPNCSTAGSTPSNIARFGNIQHNGNFVDGWSKISNAYVHLWEGDAPEIVAFTGELAGWHGNRQHDLRATVRDTGLGPDVATVQRADGSALNVSTKYGCARTHRQSWCGSDYDAGMSYNTSALAEGVNRLTVTGTDKVGNISTTNRSFDMRVDRTAPDASYGGSLASLDGQSVEITGAKHDLTVAATDGNAASAATARSGVRAIDIEVINPSGVVTRTERRTQSCPGGSCSLSNAIDFHPEIEGSGTWKFRVTSADHSQPSNSRTRTFTVTFTREYPAVTLQSDQALGSPTYGQRHFDDVDNLGVRGIRVAVTWRATASTPTLNPSACGAVPGTQAVREDPASYDFAELRRKMNEAIARGIGVTLQFDGTIPCWASEEPAECDKDSGSSSTDNVDSDDRCFWKPNVSRYREWVTAVAKAVGSHVNRWSPWNEPNIDAHLAPQAKYTTALRYRDLFFAAKSAVAPYSPAPLFFGEVTFSRRTEEITAGTDAKPFLLAAACHPRPYGDETSDRACPDANGPIRGVELAFHSYVGAKRSLSTPAFSTSAADYFQPQDNVTHIKTVRDALADLRARGLVHDDMKWVAETESGVQHGACYTPDANGDGHEELGTGCTPSTPDCASSPTNPYPQSCDQGGWAFRSSDNGERKQAGFLNCMEMNAWKGGNVGRFSQYLLQEPTRGTGTFFTALRRRTTDARPGAETAAYAAFRQPLVVYRHTDGRLEAWGAWRQRPRPSSIQLVGQDSAGNNVVNHNVPLTGSKYFHRFLSTTEAPGGLTWLTVGPNFQASRRAHGGDCGDGWTGGNQP